MEGFSDERYGIGFHIGTCMILIQESVKQNDYLMVTGLSITEQLA